MTKEAEAKTPLETAALLAVIELAIAPEFGNEWVRDILATAGADTSDESIETTIDAITEINRALVAPFIAQLPEELRKNYDKHTTAAA